MSTFEQDWAEAEHIANKKKASASRPTVSMPSLPMREGVRPVHMHPEICVSQRTKNVNHLKKVRSQNAKAQPRARGKFSKEPGFFTRLGWIITGKGRKMINASRRVEQKRMAGRDGSIPVPAKRRKRAKRK